MKVTLTGAAGRLGSTTCKLLADRGQSLTATDVQYRADLPVRLQVADLLDAPSCFRLLEGSEAVVHLANHPGVGLLGPVRCFNENVAINMNIFEAARQVGVKKIIFASSIQAIIGQRKPDRPAQDSNLPYLPLDGAVPRNPGNAYALSKAVSEQMLEYYARQWGMSCVAVRFPALVEAEHLRRWRGFLRDNPFANQNPDECSTYLSMLDAAALLDAVLRADLPGYRVYFPAAPDPIAPVPVAEMIQKFYAKLPLRRPIAQITSFVDTSLIEQETGWKVGPVPETPPNAPRP